MDRIYPSEAYILVKGQKHKAMADQMATVSKTCLSDKWGQISAKDMYRVKKAIRIQLGLNLCGRRMLLEQTKGISWSGKHKRSYKGLKLKLIKK